MMGTHSPDFSNCLEALVDGDRKVVLIHYGILHSDNVVLFDQVRQRSH